jgi:hypothetical protein
METQIECPTVSVRSGEEQYTVRRVNRGGRYGQHFCLTHNEEEPMIEFYLEGAKNVAYDFVGSREEAEIAGAKPLGYFVSRYNARTLLDTDPERGMCLHFGGQYNKSYNIYPESLNIALERLGFPPRKSNE